MIFVPVRGRVKEDDKVYRTIKRSVSFPCEEKMLTMFEPGNSIPSLSVEASEFYEV